MSCPSQVLLEQSITFYKQYSDAYGEPVDVDGTVDYDIYEEETKLSGLSGTMTKRDTGYYSEKLACTAANGFEIFKSYGIRIAAAIDSVAVATEYSFVCLPVLSVSVAAILQLLRADKVIDTAKTPWVTDYKDEDSGSTLMSKTMKNTGGANIVDVENVLGRLEKE